MVTTIPSFLLLYLFIYFLLSDKILNLNFTITFYFLLFYFRWQYSDSFVCIYFRRKLHLPQKYELHLLLSTLLRSRFHSSINLESPGASQPNHHRSISKYGQMAGGWSGRLVGAPDELLGDASLRSSVYLLWSSDENAII